MEIVAKYVHDHYEVEHGTRNSKTGERKYSHYGRNDGIGENWDYTLTADEMKILKDNHWVSDYLHSELDKFGLEDVVFTRDDVTFIFDNEDDDNIKRVNDVLFSDNFDYILDDIFMKVSERLEDIHYSQYEDSTGKAIIHIEDSIRIRLE